MAYAWPPPQVYTKAQRSGTHHSVHHDHHDGDAGHHGNGTHDADLPGGA
jgi:hypothetical protein